MKEENTRLSFNNLTDERHETKMSLNEKKPLPHIRIYDHQILPLRKITDPVELYTACMMNRNYSPLCQTNEVVKSILAECDNEGINTEDPKELRRFLDKNFRKEITQLASKSDPFLTEEGLGLGMYAVETEEHWLGVVGIGVDNYKVENGKKIVTEGFSVIHLAPQFRGNGLGTAVIRKFGGDIVAQHYAQGLVDPDGIMETKTLKNNARSFAVQKTTGAISKNLVVEEHEKYTITRERFADVNSRTYWIDTSIYRAFNGCSSRIKQGFNENCQMI